jgi:hypothetical protein
MAPEQARGETMQVGKASDVFGLGGILCVILTGQSPYTRAPQVLAGDLTEAYERLDGCVADAELIELAKACLLPVPEARPAEASEVAERVKRYREGVVARQAQAERELWLRELAGQAEQATGGGETFTPAAEVARARLRQQALALLHAEVEAQTKRLSSGDPAESTAARQVLESLRSFPALARVRNPAQADLPEPERQAWQTIWEKVETLLGEHTCP